MSICTPTIGWKSSKPTKNYFQSFFSPLMINLAHSLQRNGNRFFPFSRGVGRGSNELKSHEGEGVVLRVRANCPTRGHTVHLTTLTSDGSPELRAPWVQQFTSRTHWQLWSPRLLSHEGRTHRSAKGRDMRRVQRNTNCATFLASVCDNTSWTQSPREGRPSLSFQSFYWGSLSMMDFSEVIKIYIGFCPLVPDTWSLTLAPDTKLLKLRYSVSDTASKSLEFWGW